MIGLNQEHLEQGAPHLWGGWRSRVIEYAERIGVMLQEELYDVSSRGSGNISANA